MQLLSRICAVLLSLCAAVDAELDPAVYQRLQQSIERGQLAVIEDADGYVNVRSEPDSKSKPVLKIQKDEFFICEPSEAVWWSVSDFFGNEGFVHRSRIRLVKDLPDADLDRLLVNPLAAPRDELEQREQLYKRRYESLDGGDHAVVVGDLGLIPSDQLYSDEEQKKHLYLSYATDGLLPAALIFLREPPDAVLARVPVYKGQSPVSPAEVTRNWSKLAAASNQIPWLSCKTVRGLELGDKIEKVVALFGSPHQRDKADDVEVYRWGFPGMGHYDDLLCEVTIDMNSVGVWDLRSKGKRLDFSQEQFARLRELLRRADSRVLRDWAATALVDTRGSKASEGYGFFVTAFARNGRLIALEYSEGIL